MGRGCGGNILTQKSEVLILRRQPTSERKNDIPTNAPPLRHPSVEDWEIRREDRTATPRIVDAQTQDSESGARADHAWDGAENSDAARVLVSEVEGEIMSEENLSWMPRSIAKDWPEGCAVLWRRPYESYEKKFRYETCGWFRPDLIESGYYGNGDERYVLIERPQVKTPPPD